MFSSRTTVLGYHTHLSTLCFTQELLYWATISISLNHVFYPRTTVLGYHGHLSQPCVLPKNYCIGLPWPPLSTICFPQELLYWATMPTSLNPVFSTRTTILGYHANLSQPCVLPKNYCIRLPSSPPSTLCFTQELLYWATIATSLNPVFYPRTTVLGYHRHLSTLCFTQELLYWATIVTSQPCVLPKNYCIGLPWSLLLTLCFTQELLYWATMATSLNPLFSSRTTKGCKWLFKKFSENAGVQEPHRPWWGQGATLLWRAGRN